MIKILFETHHLYYLPNFEPIINQLKKRDNYDIYISMPQYINDREKNLFHSACELLKINIISEQDETLRIEKIISIKLDVIVVGNIGQLNMRLN